MIGHEMAHELALLRGVELRRAAEEYRRGRTRRAPGPVRLLLRAVLAPPGRGAPARDGS